MLFLASKKQKKSPKTLIHKDLRDLWNALRAWNTLRVWNALRRVRRFISFHIATKEKYFTIHEVNFFTFGVRRIFHLKHYRFYDIINSSINKNLTRRYQSEKAIKKIIIKTACTRFDSFHKHNLLFSILSFYQAILHEEMSFFIIKNLFSYLCFGCCIDVCWIILIHRNRRNFTCVDGHCNELRFLQIL